MHRTTVVAAALCVASGVPLFAEGESQGFLRVVEGAASLIRVEDGRPEAAQENIPALAGDRLSLAPGSRVEVILPDGHRVRLAESADLELVTLARSLDEAGAATVLQLRDGALAIDVPTDAADRTRVDTDAAGVLLERGGLYLVEIDDRGLTRVVVREGEAEVLTEFDSTVVRAGDEAVIDPESRTRIALYQAPPLTDVEEWARQLEAEATRADVGRVEPELRYAAEPLARHGSWVDAGAGYAWRPRVEVGWRPYWRGYWNYSPAGLVWSSYEPWGWVPYHYGAWDLHPSYGWLWYPGAVYRPAHVVWYWGPSYAGWVPSGYYGSFYARRFGFHVSFGSGFYGVSHASWHAYRDWVFCPTGSIGRRYQYRYHGDHHVLDHHGRSGGSDRAFITADTRGLDRGQWRDSGAVENTLSRQAHRRTGGTGDLPDVSAVVARSPEVSGTMLRELDYGDDQPPRVAVHRRPGGPRGGGTVAAEPTAPMSGAQTPSTRVAPRRPPVLADDGVARPAPARVNGAESGPTARRPVDQTRARPLVTESPRPQVRGDDGGRAVRTRRPAYPITGNGDTADAATPAPRVLRRTSPGVDTARAGDDQPRSTEPRARVARPEVERVAPQRPQVDRSLAPRSGPQAAPAERSYTARVPRSQGERSYAPAPRGQAERSYAPRPAPLATAPTLPPVPLTRSAPPAQRAPVQPASRESRGGPAPISAAPPSPRRVESSRPAPASESRAASSSSGGGDGGAQAGGRAHARHSGSGQGARGDAGRASASRRH